MRACLPAAGPLGCGACHGTWTPSPSERASAVVKYILLMSHHARGVGPEHSISLPLLPVSMWLFPYILSCIWSVLLVFSSVHFQRELFCILVVGFGESKGEGELRTFLFYHLGPTSKVLSLCLILSNVTVIYLGVVFFVVIQFVVNFGLWICKLLFSQNLGNFLLCLWTCIFNPLFSFFSFKDSTSYVTPQHIALHHWEPDFYYSTS